MSELGSIEKIDAARAELARHGITLESFETMRARIDALEGVVRGLVESFEEFGVRLVLAQKTNGWPQAEEAASKMDAMVAKARALLEE